MKISILDQNQISDSVVDLIGRIVERISWPARRLAMAEATQSLLDGKVRVAEYVFGWNRSTVELGMNELRTGIVCVNDLSARRKPKTEEKYPKMLADIRRIMDSKSHAHSHLRTPFSYTNMTAAAVRTALIEKGWADEMIPTIRTLSNILNRQDYRLRRVSKTQVQKKLQRPMQSSKMLND